jgi:photosystem II stability/assembly factor-like uncharacterized protein
MNETSGKRRLFMRSKLPLILLLIILTACDAQTTPIAANPLIENRTPEATTTDTPVNTPVPVTNNAAVIESPSLQYIVMLDELDGWGVTDTQIVRTNDGGSTWFDVTPPELSAAGFSGATSFLDVDHAWVQVPDVNNIPNAGTLYRTTNGGMTWTSNSVPFSSGHIVFLDEKDGWVLADLGAGAGSQAVAVFITQDGGETWKQTFINDPNNPIAAETLPLSGIKGDLVPINLQTAWITGVTYSPATVYLYRTDDSGVTWSQVNVELPENVGQSEVEVAQMKFVTEKDGFFALRISGQTFDTALYVTHDAGNTWSLLPTILSGQSTTEFISAQEIVFYNGQQFYVSKDAGQTWEAVTPDVDFGDSFAGMTFANISTGWVITSNSDRRTLYKTMDGGAHWSAIIP